MAGLHKDKRSGIYTVQFHDADRTPRRKQVSTRTREVRSARRLYRLWESAYAEARYDPWVDAPPVPGEAPTGARKPGSVSLGDARREFLESRSHRALNTRLNYERVTGWFVDSVGKGRPVRSVRAADVQAWIDTLDVRAVTKANYVRHLRAFFRYCMTVNKADADPTEEVGLERVPRQFPKALRPEEVEAVAAYAEAHCRDGERRSAAWAAPFIRLGAETAMRRNELLHLRWGHVDLERGVLTVACTDAFTSKSGAERRVPLSDRAASVLGRLRRGGRRRRDSS